ncbi:MAG TPA: peptidoglycan recognition family protein [Solirubrobacteraceae bacterium]
MRRTIAAVIAGTAPRCARLTALGVALLAALATGCGTSAGNQGEPQAHVLATAASDGGTPAGSSTSATPTTSGPSTPVARATAPTVATTPAPATPAIVVPKPHIIQNPIPFGPERRAQMVEYARRHYGSFMTPTYKLRNPHVIVIHYTVSPTFESTYNTFAPDIADPELHELPNTCSHFVIDQGGAIHQLVPLGIMCRHTVGLNWTAIGIEHVGFSDAEVLGDRAQLNASLKLVRWLRCRYHISIANVIGHNESLSSPYHREDVQSLRTQTHSDFVRADMRVYRQRLARAGACT